MLMLTGSARVSSAVQPSRARSSKSDQIDGTGQAGYSTLLAAAGQDQSNDGRAFRNGDLVEILST